ncbi:MAG: TatD family hydrolase [bacterium]|nr:TatD family hydrolase [bacterium]
MNLVDAHCHLESPELVEDLDSILKDAGDAGIVKLITSAVTPRQWPVSVSIARKYPEVECALGVHPWFASPEHREKIRDLAAARDTGAVAIGEIGLDKKIENPDFTIQTEIFEQQLAIARETDLPVIIHCRGAFNELIESIKKVGMPSKGGIIHAFSGSVELAEIFIKLGLSFSIGGTLTYRKSAKRSGMLRRIYPDHFLLETDSPDIPPVQIKEKPNVPANIRLNLSAAADILEVPEEEIARNTSANAARIFQLAVDS